MSNLESLLQPSLQQQPTKSMYSVGAHFLVAFFGGPLGLAIFIFLSVRLIDKLGELKLLLALVVLATLAMYASSLWLYMDGIPPLLQLGDNPSSTLKILLRAGAMLMLGAVYLALRPYFKASELAANAPSAWAPGILVVFVGNLVPYLVLLRVSAP